MTETETPSASFVTSSGAKRFLSTKSIVSVLLLGFFTLLILLQAPSLFAKSDEINLKFNDLIPVAGDTHEYQRLAVNLLNGRGFTDSIVLPLETYHLDPSFSPLGKLLENTYNTNGHKTKARYSFYSSPGFH